MLKYLLLLLLSLSALSFVAQDKIIVVIDAGHGGKDPGNLNKTKGFMVEKNLNLSISKKLGAYITEYLGHKVKVVYSRTTDVFIPLDERVNRANKMNASYFISIHCNASDNPAVHGTETHIHNIKSKSSRELGLLIEKQFKNRDIRSNVKDTIKVLSKRNLLENEYDYDKSVLCYKIKALNGD